MANAARLFLLVAVAAALAGRSGVLVSFAIFLIFLAHAVGWVPFAISLKLGSRRRWMSCGLCLELEDGAWCVCRTDLADSALQKTLDYACGGGADCKPILQNGACFAPDTVKAHCSYAVNSFYQRNNQNPQACVFSGTATLSNNDPSESTAPPPNSSFSASPRQFSDARLRLLTLRLTSCFFRGCRRQWLHVPCDTKVILARHCHLFATPSSLFLTHRDRGDMSCCREFVASAFLGTGTTELALLIRAKAIYSLHPQISDPLAWTEGVTFSNPFTELIERR
jgi:hypothetical protein